jgi:hypothetical protein
MAQGLLVPGILQTEKYARLVTNIYSAPEDADSIVQMRLARQEEVFARTPEQCHFLDEAVLRRRVGDTMPGQLRRLIELASRPEVTIRVIPFGAGPHFGMKGPFVLLGFDVPLGVVLFLESGRRNDLIICEEAAYSDQILRDSSEPAEIVASFEEGFSEIGRIALDEAESAALIERIVRESALERAPGSAYPAACGWDVVVSPGTRVGGLAAALLIGAFALPHAGRRLSGRLSPVRAGLLGGGGAEKIPSGA